jgi:hypothetical protein
MTRVQRDELHIARPSSAFRTLILFDISQSIFYKSNQEVSNGGGYYADHLESG